MASTTQKWFIGCGIGCGLMILITAVLGGGIFFAVKDVMKDGEAIEESNNAMVDAFGTPEEFTPTVDGSIAPVRMEIFLTTREETAESMNKMADILHTLDDESEEGESNWVAKIKAGVTMIPTILAYINDRNVILLENGMGDGEYTYIYTLSYFAYLDMDLTDGPSFQMTGASGDDDDDGVSWKVESGSDKTEVRDKREKNIRRQMHKLQLSFLMNQMASLDNSGLDEELRLALETERDAMNSARRRLLWEEGLPPAIEASLAPYADRLRESYLPILNVIEMGLVNTN